MGFVVAQTDMWLFIFLLSFLQLPYPRSPPHGCLSTSLFSVLPYLFYFRLFSTSLKISSFSSHDLLSTFISYKYIYINTYMHTQYSRLFPHMRENIQLLSESRISLNVMISSYVHSPENVRLSFFLYKSTNSYMRHSLSVFHLLMGIQTYSTSWLL